MTTDQVLTYATVAVAAFTACAEFGSYAFVHPVLRRLDVAAHIQVEQGLVRTFGRVMPFLMTGSLVLIIAWSSTVGSGAPPLRVLAIVVWGFGLVTTVLVNVGINLRTAGWDPRADPERWRAMRHRWEAFQGVRSWAFLVSFLLLLAAVVDGGSV
jgi:Domain of unknown function (DUF1772)